MKQSVFTCAPLRCAVPAAGQRINKKNLIDFWHVVRKDIDKRLRDFQTIDRNADDNALFCELMFCLFTPQSKAVFCWAAVESLRDGQLVSSGTRDKIAETLRRRVRFHRNKSSYVIEARNRFFTENAVSLRETLDGFPSSRAAREWLVKNIRGLGYKEASHFLRNIGRGSDIAILDRHILRNLKELCVIRDVPSALTPRKYFEIEDAMSSFSRATGIPMDHLDILLWCHETGEIFK